MNLYIVIIVILLLLMFYKTSLNWRHKEAANYLSVAINKFGKPSVLDSSPGGLAIWKATDLQGTCYIRHELHDESIVHLKPAKHHDFFYTTINYEIPDQFVHDVIRLSGSISYDPLKKELTARCGNLEANIATLALATQIGEGKISWRYIQDNELYRVWIQSTQNQESVNKMYNLLCHNINRQSGDPTPGGYFRLAFPQG